MDNLLSSKTNTATSGFDMLEDIDGKIKISVRFDKDLINENSEILSVPQSKLSSTKLLEQKEIRNSVEGLEGELLIDKDSSSILEIDVTGELHISNDESDKYEIDDLGHLIYNIE